VAGILLWCWDELCQWALPGGHWGRCISDGLELLLMGPGLAGAAFLASELLARRVSEERSRRFALLGVVSASVAHEVRNPVHNLRLLLDEAALDGTLDPAGELHRRLEANVERLRQAVELVYCLARPEPRTATGSTCDLVAALAAAGVPAPPVSRPALVAAEPVLVQLVLGNLLRNARAELAPGTDPEVRLEEHPEAWVVELANPGLLPPDAGAGPVASAKPDGLGLGLYLCRQLAESVHGALDVSGRDGRVVARLRLPRTMP
jgi:signal transduction histidine kinase